MVLIGRKLRLLESYKTILGLLIIVAPLLYGFIGQGCFVLLYLSLIGIVFYLYRQRSVTLSVIDIFVALYLIYGCCNILFVKENGTDGLLILEWILLISIYILSRGWNDRKTMILYFLILSGAVQSLIGILQLNGIIESNHSDFLLTGSFPNPGPYGGYLALSFVAAIQLLIQQETKFQKTAGILFSLLLLVMVVLSDSRAAYLSIIVGVIYIISSQVQIKSRLLLLGGLFLFIIICLVALYFYRIDSADARLLLWRVCFDIFKENPFFGNGIASLPSLYMDYQADYFANHPNSEFIALANNHYQAFNEFIHILCEQGIAGLVLFITILIFVFRSNCDRGIKALLLTLLVFSCFSYPSDVLSLKMMFPLFIGLLVSKPFFQFRLSRWSVIIPLLFIVIVIHTHIRYKNAFRDIVVATFPLLPDNRDYMLRYAKKNSNIETLTYLTKNICSSSEILCDMGDAYLNMGDTLSADSCYKKAFHMVPNRILPLYNLFLLHQDSVSAQKIVDFEPKITNSLTLRAKAQCKEYLKL